MINIDSRLLSALDANEMYLLLNLTNRINGDRFCFPGNKTLCGELKWSKEKLQQVKKRLTEKGVIEIERRFKDNSPGQTSNIYRILTPQVGNYTPGGKNGTGEVGKLAGGIPEILPPSGGIISPPGVGKPGNEVLTNEVLTTEELNTEELKRENHHLNFCVHSIFQNLIDCLFPQFEAYRHCMVGYFEVDEIDEITDPTIRRSLEKILGAARAIHSAYEKLNRPIPKWRDYSNSWSREEGKPDPTQDSVDQIQSYQHWCELTKTWMTSDPDKLPEKLLQVDWCQKLKEYVDERFPKEYDPIKYYVENEMYPDWIMNYFYDQQMVYVDRKNPDRIF